MIIAYDANEANVEKRVGSGQYAFEILRTMAEKIEPDILRIYLKTAPRIDFPQPSENIKYDIFGPKPLWTQIALPLRLYTHKKPSVFFSPAHYAPRFSPVPTVVTIHDLAYVRFPDYFLKKDIEQLRRWTAYSIKNAAHIIVPSEATKQDVVKYYEYPENRITVIPHGYDRDRFHKDLDPAAAKQMRQLLGLPEDYILYLGTLQPRKNIIRLLKAYHQARSAGITNSLVITGKRGWLYDDIFSTVESLGLKQHVIFTDYVKDEDVPYLYAGARLYILPSLYEGFGLPLIEAMACGTPVAAANNSSLPEVIGPGMLFDPNDSNAIAQTIEKAVRMPGAEYIRVKEAGIKFANQFSWPKAAEETLAVLRKVGIKSQ